ncbi:hypothetical protein [Paenibacillus sp. J2TS4]|uniref:hypothetical protein n=1 Tax=Paenibacillus sp. J2TS4 TaxID=2807194 RepID=UPI001B1C7A1C|nr:hypothetical protein [Paenibacillus sp. J2TS4]GIP31248.1 hypothetical protein J2TS4_04580 [Paenibacillus sp. J2TS4]
MKLAKLTKRLFKLLLLILGLVVILAAALWLYVKPDKPLDLAYGPVSIRDKVEQMIRSRQLSFQLSKEEINSLVKKAILEHPLPLPPDLQIEGVDIQPVEQGFVGEFNLRYKERLRFAATADVRIEWQSPELYIELEQVKVKKLPIPNALLDKRQYRLRLDEQLPSFVDLSRIDFHPNGVQIEWTIDPDRVEELLDDLLRKWEKEFP